MNDNCSEIANGNNPARGSIFCIFKNDLRVIKHVTEMKDIYEKLFKILDNVCFSHKKAQLRKHENLDFFKIKANQKFQERENYNNLEKTVKYIMKNFFYQKKKLFRFCFNWGICIVKSYWLFKILLFCRF